MSPIVKNEAVPVGMDALSGITVLIEMSAIKISQPVLITGKMGRHPVKDYSYIMLVQTVNEVHEILRAAVAAGRGEIAGRLIAPGAVEGMLHHRQELNMGKAHLLRILSQPGSERPVGEKAVSFFRHSHHGTQ